MKRLPLDPSRTQPLCFTGGGRFKAGALAAGPAPANLDGALW